MFDFSHQKDGQKETGQKVLHLGQKVWLKNLNGCKVILQLKYFKLFL